MSEIINQAGISYKYRINPSGTDLSKSINSDLNTINLVASGLEMVQTVDKTHATIGDVLTYTIVLKNTGNILLTNIIFNNAIPASATFVTGSVTVDGVAQPTFTPLTGFNVSNLIIGASVTIKYQATVKSLPTPNTIINQATTTYSYLVGGIINGTSSSNNVTTTINVSNLAMTKTADVVAAKSGDTIKYTIKITNNGNINASNIQFIDPIDSKVTFVAGSVEINGTAQPTYDAVVGFNLDDIVPRDIITITFKVKVK